MKCISALKEMKIGALDGSCSSLVSLTHYGLVMPYDVTRFQSIKRSGNGMLSDGNKPLPETICTKESLSKLSKSRNDADLHTLKIIHRIKS